MADVKLAASAAILEIFEEVASLALLAHLGAGECVQQLERAFVIAAERMFMEEDRSEPSVTQVANRTGLTNKKVSAYQQNEKGPLPEVVRHQSRTSRVIYGWRKDKERGFSNADGTPRILPLRGKGSFAELVRIWGKRERSKPLLKELLYHGMVSVLDDQRVQLLTNEPVGKFDPQDIVELGRSTGVLIEALRRRLDRPDGVAGQYFRHICNVQMKPGDALVQTRDHARQAESFANSLATFIEDQSVTLRAAHEPRPAESVHVLLCVTHHPVVVPAIEKPSQRGDKSSDRKKGSPHGRRRTKSE